MHNDWNSDHMIHLFISAGVATAPLYMEGFRRALHSKNVETGRAVYSELLFPYGDSRRALTAQLREVAHDLRKGAGYGRFSIGGSRLLARVDECRLKGGFRSGATILIGHSAGGTASLYAQQQLLKREGKPSPIVMIGSPRCRIPSALREDVLYIYAANRAKLRRAALKQSDPITRIGSFGGWMQGKHRIPVWRHDLHAPIASLGLPLIGGHADYFREKEPYVNAAGQSNLELSLEAVWEWLKYRKY